MPRRVFVLGAGASKACGLPLTNEILPRIIPKIAERSIRKRLRDFISYLYPYFNKKWGNYPNLEELLGQFDIYLKFSDKVKTKHRFPIDEIENLRDELLRAICIFLTSHPDERIPKSRIDDLAADLRPADIVISFNWDLTLERSLTKRDPSATWSYVQDDGSITILKPHGSVNWFDSKKIRLSKDKTSPLTPNTDGPLRVFKPLRFPHVEKKIVPVIVPPVFNKEWPYPEFDEIWRDTWTALAETDALYIIGFSLPPEDLHVRFVMRTALRINEKKRVGGLSEVCVVNPDRAVFLRFARLMRTPIQYVESPFERVSMDDLIRKS